MDIKNNVFVVTGAARGLGFEIAKDLATAGGKLALIDLNQEGLDEAANTLKEFGVEVRTYAANVANETHVVEAFDKIQNDFGQIDGTENPFFTSEFVEGRSLLALGRAMTFDELYDVLVQVCRALDYIHNRGFIHHDIKPEGAPMIIVLHAPGKETKKTAECFPGPRLAERCRFWYIRFPESGTPEEAARRMMKTRALIVLLAWTALAGCTAITEAFCTLPVRYISSGLNCPKLTKSGLELLIYYTIIIWLYRQIRSRRSGRAYLRISHPGSRRQSPEPDP